MDILGDPLAMRGIERLFVVAASALFGFLGYKLFVFGVTTGRSTLTAESKIIKLVFSGTGPGLFFMFVAGCVLFAALLTGGAERTKTITDTTGTTGTLQRDSRPVTGVSKTENPNEDELRGSLTRESHEIPENTDEPPVRRQQLDVDGEITSINNNDTGKDKEIKRSLDRLFRIANETQEESVRTRKITTEVYEKIQDSSKRPELDRVQLRLERSIEHLDAVVQKLVETLVKVQKTASESTPPNRE
jgi:hypothetical protein